MSYHIYHIVSYRIIYHTISYISYRIITYRIIYHIVSYHITSYRISYIVSYRIIYHIITIDIRQWHHWASQCITSYCCKICSFQTSPVTSVSRITWGPHGVLALSDDAVNCYDYKASVIDERVWRTDVATVTGSNLSIRRNTARMAACPPQTPHRRPGIESGGQLTAWGESHRMLLRSSVWRTPLPLCSVDLKYTFLGIVCTLMLHLPLRYPGSLYPQYTLQHRSSELVTPATISLRGMRRGRRNRWASTVRYNVL